MKKFGTNDLFYNTILATPKFSIVFQSGSLRINDQVNQNLEKSSSISGIEYESSYDYQRIFSTREYTSSITPEFVYSSSANGWEYKYSNYSTIKKVSTLKNTFSDYLQENQYSSMAYYLLNDAVPASKGTYYTDWQSNLSDASFRNSYFIKPAASIKLLNIPRDFYGNNIEPGSVELHMYVSGALTASAKDVDKTGKLIQTFGGTTGSVVGSVFYDHGTIFLTGSEALSSEQAPYIQPLSIYTASASPIVDYLKWIYFGAYQETTGSGIETKYELVFKGTSYVPTITMLCHAEKGELFWSSNKTFIESGQGDEIFVGQSATIEDVTGSTYTATSGSIIVPSNKKLQENKTVLIKNTISSSFVHYSASYEPQTFISQIGIYDEDRNLIAMAKVANPVKKTKQLDYTFKIKLDF